MRYIKHWMAKKKELEEYIREVGPENRPATRVDIDLYARIRATLDGILVALHLSRREDSNPRAAPCDRRRNYRRAPTNGKACRLVLLDPAQRIRRHLLMVTTSGESNGFSPGPLNLSLQSPVAVDGTVMSMRIIRSEFWKISVEIVVLF